MSRLWLITFLDRPAHSFVLGADRVSRFSRVEVPCMSGVLDLAGPAGARDSAPTSVAFPPNKLRQHPYCQIFRGSIPRLHVPLSTLRVQPYDWPRMTRGRCGSLRLRRTALPSAPPRRFIPAHLLVAQGDYRIHLRGTAGRDVTCQKRHAYENDRHDGKRDRIGRLDAIKQAR